MFKSGKLMCLPGKVLRFEPFLLYGETIICRNTGIFMAKECNIDGIFGKTFLKICLHCPFHGDLKQIS